MATIKDLQYSMNGEPLKKTRLGKELSGLVTYPVDEKTGKVIYPTGKKWYVFKLVDNNKQGGVRIASTDDVINPKSITKENPNGTVERMRLLTGVSSIWLKDQKDLPKDYEKQNWVELRFFRGQKMMRVAATNTTALEFLRLTNSNIGNPLRVRGSRHEFYEYDSAIAETEQFERENFELEMAILAKQEKADVMRKHAAFLGVRMINDATGEPKSEDGIRREYVMAAKRNPEYFQKTRNTPQIEVSWLVRKAISETLIDVGREPGKIFWSNGGGMICVLPQTMNAQAYLTELAMTNSEEGIKFKEQLKQIAT